MGTLPLGFQANLHPDEEGTIIIGVPAVFEPKIVFSSTPTTQVRVSQSDPAEPDAFSDGGWSNSVHPASANSIPWFNSTLGRRFMTNLPVQFRVSDLSTFNPNTSVISVNYTMSGSMVLVNYPVVSAYEKEYCVLEWGTNKRTIIHSKNPTTLIENTGSFTLTYYQRVLLTTNPTTYGYRLATLSNALFNGDVDKRKGKELPIRMISYS
ncbi:TPA: hypothetical protein ACOAY7_002818 [Vibrio cholerae]